MSEDIDVEALKASHDAVQAETGELRSENERLRAELNEAQRVACILGAEVKRLRGE